MENPLIIEEMPDQEKDFYVGLVIVAVVVIAIVLGVVKVKNELAMTEEYHAQAVAQSRQADALERIADQAERGFKPVTMMTVLSYGTSVSPGIAFCGKYSECR